NLFQFRKFCAVHRNPRTRLPRRRLDFSLFPLIITRFGKNYKSFVAKAAHAFAVVKFLFFAVKT
ncbi:MAG: hypothetical protein K2N74_03030, partial [Clostridiales bacterium]|nr:hypothetical protein [Clostridiales bacterium]